MLPTRAKIKCCKLKGKSLCELKLLQQKADKMFDNFTFLKKIVRAFWIKSINRQVFQNKNTKAVVKKG